MGQVVGIRLVLTTKCQLSCIFCHREGWKSAPYGKDAKMESIIESCRKLRPSWGNDITLTGGEPLLHHKIFSFIESLHSLDYELSLVTNGQCLENAAEHLDFIKDVHVSIPTLDSHHYTQVTGGSLPCVIRGIRRLRKEFPKKCLKINCVVGESTPNIQELVRDLIQFSIEYVTTLKFILQFDYTELRSFHSAHLYEIILGHGYTQFGYNGRTASFKRTDRMPIEVSEVTCSVAQRYPDPCHSCGRWKEAYVGVNGEIMFCPWK